MATFDLTDMINYNEEIVDSFKKLSHVYELIVLEYLNCISDKPFDYAIKIRGLETITHVFMMMMIYTKNSKCAIYYSQKAFYLFTEFIEQIKKCQNTFLQLTAKDAMLFVYKKTVFEIIHSKSHKLTKKDSSLLEDFKLFTLIIKQIMSPTFTPGDFKTIATKFDFEQQDIQPIYVGINLICDSLEEEPLKAIHLFLNLVHSEKVIHYFDMDASKKEIKKDYIVGIKQLFKPPHLEP